MTQNKYFPLIIICLTIIFSFYIASRTGIYIKSTGGTLDNSGKITNTISVTGDGHVSVKPDMATISFSFSETASTSRTALDKVNQKMTQAMLILKNNAIPDTDITTSGLSIYPEYDYSQSVAHLTGQRASESVSVKIKKIDSQATKVSTLVDQLSAIDNVQLGGISFDIDDKTKYFSEARRLAFNKAQQKAVELAKLSGVNLAKPVSITDTVTDISPRPYFANVASMKVGSLAAPAADNTSVSTGQMDISVSLNILWGME
jgi:uncharacterized protein